MTRRRWIADEVTGNTAALVGEHAAHLARVLRAEVGQEFDIATGDEVRRGTITTISYDRVEFALDAKPHRRLRSLPSAAPKITLALAIFKFDRMEWAIEKCTEIGVARIIPVIARRTDAHLAAAAVKRHERWQRIVRQAAEQSRRSAPPEVAAPVKLKELAGVLPAGELTRIVLAESRRRHSAGRSFAIAAERSCARRGARRRMGFRGTLVVFRRGMGCGLAWRHDPAGGNCGDCRYCACAGRVCVSRVLSVRNLLS